MNKRTHDELQARKELQGAGWEVNKRDAVAFNGGSETVRHAVAKLLVAHYLRSEGYRVDTEVKKDGVGEIDVVAYGNGEPPFAVEIETEPTKATVQDKLERYYEGEPFCECYIIDPTEMPEGITVAAGWIGGQL